MSSIFLSSPIWVFVFSFVAWSLVPLGDYLFFFDYRFSLFLFLVISGFSVYGIILAG
jgi:NADH:ubiquinone oxidoreductase subunit H